MRKITVYTKNLCSFCNAAKQLLRAHDYQFDEINLEGDEKLMTEIMTKSGQRTMPQIFVDDHSVGGYRELSSLIANGEFKSLNDDL